jgi:hypothetical protein
MMDGVKDILQTIEDPEDLSTMLKQRLVLNQLALNKENNAPKISREDMIMTMEQKETLQEKVLL